MTELGERLGNALVPSTMVGLSGTLGAGKTTLIQGIGRGLRVGTDVTSPTFTLAIPYQGRLGMLHVDAYRISDLVEVDDLALDDWIEDGGVVVVEWFERVASALPPRDLTVEIEIADEDGRQVTLTPHSETGRTVVRQLRESLSGRPLQDK